MTNVFAAAAFSVLIAGTASAQQSQPSQAPQQANPSGTSAPPADAFKNAGRPESHGGTVHSPQVGAGSATHDTRELVHAVARSTTTAQQYGNLASMRHASGAAHELGDRMILTNSRINKALVAAYPELRGSEQMSPEERGTFDNLARRANEAEFGVSLAQWVMETYPGAISALERLGQGPQFRELATTALPELRAQLADANRLLETARASPSQVESKPGAAAGSNATGAKARSD